MFNLRFFIPLILWSVTFGAPQEDLVTDLPGLELPVTFQQYSGYLNGTPGRHLHYWFVESQGDPVTDPLILWLNGGPGCSSLLGFLTELGPFTVSQDGSNTLVPNVYSWNTAGSVIFLESPACVGFSYDDASNCQTGDVEVAQMNYLALQDFFAKFPEYANHDFYITGESYAGIYIPTLSENIVNGQATYPINFQGYAIGNGIYNYVTNDNSLLFYAYYHSVLGETEWENLVSTCCTGGLDNKASCNFTENPLLDCQVLVNKAFVQIYYGGLNPYDLYGNCVTPIGDIKPTAHNLEMRNIFKRFWSREVTPEPFGDCGDNAPEITYLNTPEVRTALHIPTTVQAWDVCSGEVSSLYTGGYDTTVPLVGFLQSSGIRGLIYNGDTDMVCNFLGNEWCIEELGLPAIEGRRQWTVQNQVAGYVEKHDNLDYVTVKGSGHMVPDDKPQESLHMITSFINNVPY